ncbi:Abi-alpha family protein [Spirosoma jeollabukense]
MENTSVNMKEIIQSLNLPKQILDKTEELMKTLFGPATKELGELFADKMRYRRLKNQISIFNKTVYLLEQNNLKPKELKLKTLVPLLEQCSLEENEELQEKWANLLTNIATSPENGLEPRLVKTLSNLTPLEAQILDFSFDEMHKNRAEALEQRKKWGKPFINDTLESIKLNSIIIRADNIKKRFKIDDQFISICIDNMILLGLLKYEDPEVEIDNGSSNGELVENEDKKQKVELDLNVSASFNQSNDFKITPFGRYFVESCKTPKIPK